MFDFIKKMISLVSASFQCRIVSELDRRTPEARSIAFSALWLMSAYSFGILFSLRTIRNARLHQMGCS